MKNAPAYVKVYSRLKNEINKGTYPVGGFLPKECELEKIYQAIVCGKPVDNVGKYVDYLLKDGKTNTSRIVDKSVAGAKRAELDYQILEEKEQEDGTVRSLVEIHLHTGRHHQIRVQMAHAGMPLVGDRKYNPGQNSQEPLALCSAKLGFQHPVTKKQLEFQVQPAGMAFKRH